MARDRVDYRGSLTSKMEGLKICRGAVVLRSQVCSSTLFRVSGDRPASLCRQLSACPRSRDPLWSERFAGVQKRRRVKLLCLCAHIRMWQISMQ